MNFNPTLIQISKVIGTPVISSKGEKIGAINDVALYDKNGVVAYLVVELFNQKQGRSDELFAIPWSVFTMSEDSNTMIFTIDDRMLMNAPSFMKKDWLNANQNKLIIAVYEHYKLNNQLDAQMEDYNSSNSKGLGNSGKVASISDKSDSKTTIERAGINDNKKSYMY